MIDHRSVKTFGLCESVTKMKDFVENIYKVGDQKHNCPCTAVREIKNFTVSLLKKTRPRLEEKRVHSVAGELIEKAIYQMQTSPELKQLKMSTPPAPQELNKATPVSLVFNSIWTIRFLFGH